MSESPPPYDTTTKQFTLRLPKSLHDRITTAAEAKPTHPTLTDEIIERLAASFQPADTVSRLLSNLDLAPVRLRSLSNTTADVDRLLQVASLLSAERWIFAARPDDLNGAAMVLYIEGRGGELVAVHDHSYINMARRPRMLDVQQLTLGLDRLGILAFAEYCPALLDDTRERSPAAAAAAIIAAGPRELDLAAYLSLLAQHDAFSAADFVAAAPSPPRPRKRS